MAQRNWDSLSSDYRSRLESKGISKSQYESGASLSGARGHGRTPEHPHEGREQERFREYHVHRDQLIRDVVEMKRLSRGDRPQWSETGARKAASRMSNRAMEAMVEYDDLDDYLDDMGEEADDEADKYHE